MPASPVILPGTVRRALVRHARESRPEECCGLLVGRRAEILFACPTDNLAGSAVRYEVDPEAHIDLRRVLRRLSPPVQIVGAYHSHPRGPAEPSRADIAESFSSDWLHVIVGLRGGRAEVAGFRIRGARVIPVRLVTALRGGRGRSRR